jgi:hypothetical protein
MPNGLSVSLAQAQAVIQAAVAEAKKRNWKMNLAARGSDRQAADGDQMILMIMEAGSAIGERKS